MNNRRALRRAGVVVVSAAACFAVIASAESSDSSDSPETTEASADGGSDTTISQGLGSADASSDVTAVSIVTEGEEPFLIQSAKVTITNNSEGTSDYFITVAAETPDGATRFGETIVSAMALEPGQTTEATTMFFEDLPPDAVAVVKEVQRTAS
ncbi:MAG: hypothetical protein ACK4V6_14555 [Microthrixaceae bacterium]